MHVSSHIPVVVVIHAVCVYYGRCIYKGRNGVVGHILLVALAQKEENDPSATDAVCLFFTGLRYHAFIYIF